MSGFAGDFVVSTAGPDLESVIAGQGSGAQRFSEENSTVVVNLDIGGGTTNIVLFDCGEVKARGCLDIGGRQVTLDSEGKIAYISPSARRIAETYRLPLKLGETARRELLDALCDRMNELLEQLLGVDVPCQLLEEIQTAGAADFVIPADVSIRYLCFSGGVADCIYKPGTEPFAYGDIGVLLGDAIRRGRLFHSFHIMEAAETIRATVIGAGSYTTTISGSTISYADGMFPLKNVPVLRLNEEEEAACWMGDVSLLHSKARWFLSQNDAERMALALKGRADPGYAELKQLAETLTEAMDSLLAEGAPFLLIAQQDIAKALGQLMSRLLGKRRPVIAIDGIHVDQNNFVDLGNPIMNGLVVPVIVKTLILAETIGGKVMSYRTLLSGQIFTFDSVKDVLAKASEEKSGDTLAGIAARSDMERIAAKEILAGMTLKELYESPIVPYEEDEVTRINIDGLNENIYRKIQGWTVSDLREWLLRYETCENDIHHIARGLTSEMIAAVCKLMTNLDLIYAAQKIRVTAHCNTTVGERGIMGTRLQPNHTTDNVEGITASLFEGLSYGCGDVLIGLNPAGDSVSSLSEVLKRFDEVKMNLKFLPRFVFWDTSPLR